MRLHIIFSLLYLPVLLMYIMMCTAFSQPIQNLNIDITPYSLNGKDTIFDNQQDKYIIISNIVIEGNKRTKRKIILRELILEINDTIPLNNLQYVLEQSRKNIFNTGLFNEVNLYIKPQKDNKGQIHIIVKERWYTFPIPIFELADRNFNVWWVEQKKDLSRTEYGIRFYQENCRGRNEELKTVVQFGYTQKFELFYSIPFIDKRQHKGIRFAISYSRNKEIEYKTDSNKLVFYEDNNNYIRKRFYSGLTFSHRKAIHNTHFLDISYHHNIVGDTIAALNKNYFLYGNVSQKYFSVKYIFESDYRDIKAYPLKGSLAILQIGQSGIGIFNNVNILSFLANYTKFWQLGKKDYLVTSLKTKLSFPDKQPYFNQQAFGYNQVLVRGYEYYVIDGQQYALGKVSMKHQLFSYKFKKFNILPIEEFRTIPIALYFKIHADAGYVKDNFFYSDNNNFLENSLLLGGGIGFDFVTYYDIVLRVEYSFINKKDINDKIEKGFFFHFKSAF